MLAPAPFQVFLKFIIPLHKSDQLVDKDYHVWPLRRLLRPQAEFNCSEQIISQENRNYILIYFGLTANYKVHLLLCLQPAACVTKGEGLDEVTSSMNQPLKQFHAEVKVRDRLAQL